MYLTGNYDVNLQSPFTSPLYFYYVKGSGYYLQDNIDYYRAFNQVMSLNVGITEYFLG